MSSIIDKEKPEVRKIQAIHGNTTFVLVVPREFVERLRIAKGDYVKCTIVDESLVVRKADL
jgi:antitoxin component of MazEF toxin-antitoxin module